MTNQHSNDPDDTLAEAAGEQGVLNLPGLPVQRPAIDSELDSETVDELLSEAHTAGD